MPHSFPDRRLLFRRGVFLLAAAAALLVGAGCGGDTVRVTGRLVKDGQPYAVNRQAIPMDILAVDFRGNVGERKFLFAATTQSDGTFSVGGPDGKGIPRGQYRITVLHAGPEGAGGDKFKGRYTAEKTPLIVDISENTSLTIDLGSGRVSK